MALSGGFPVLAGILDDAQQRAYSFRWCSGVRPAPIAGDDFARRTRACSNPGFDRSFERGKLFRVTRQ
jgi:hypothetical protein